MQQPIFAFVFPFGEGRGEFRCKRNFVSEHAACEWAASMLDNDEVCYLAECMSADHVFEPACESHIAVSWDADGSAWDALYIIDDFVQGIGIYPKG